MVLRKYSRKAIASFTGCANEAISKPREKYLASEDVVTCEFRRAWELLVYLVHMAPLYINSDRTTHLQGCVLMNRFSQDAHVPKQRHLQFCDQKSKRSSKEHHVSWLILSFTIVYCGRMAKSGKRSHYRDVLLQKVERFVPVVQESLVEAILARQHRQHVYIASFRNLQRSILHFVRYWGESSQRQR